MDLPPKFARLWQRLERTVDDPHERRTLMRQALEADAARHKHKAAIARHAMDYHHRRGERMRFLLEAVAELRPDIQHPGAMTAGQLVALVEPTHPDLAGQLRKLFQV